ncbi:MAG: hypothetical protein GY858_01455 [Candidatus Omnitrophica bacterium]|nr:hypothetical protein [Candidatus Omnitrophota bacterium]
MKLLLTMFVAVFFINSASAGVYDKIKSSLKKSTSKEDASHPPQQSEHLTDLSEHASEAFKGIDVNSFKPDTSFLGGLTTGASAGGGGDSGDSSDDSSGGTDSTPNVCKTPSPKTPPAPVPVPYPNLIGEKQQENMQKENRAYQTISNLLKNKHDTAQNSIRNIK